MTDNRAAGLKVFKELLPGLVPDTATTLRDDGFAGELGELGLEHVFGALWTRPGLDRRSRSLVTLGAPIALQNGLTIEELEEVLYHLTGYVGYPAVSNARAVGCEVLPQKDQDPA